METTIFIERIIPPERQGEYFTIPFTMPANSEYMTLSYRYARHAASETPAGSGSFTARAEINIIDLGLIDPSGRQVGASGSDKSEIYVSETQATPGYRPTRLAPGEWQILVGAYKIQPGGVSVTYEIRFQEKTPRWLKGDLHAHTSASDGVHTLEELAWKAKRHDLDYLAITDHNQMTAADELPRLPGLTLIPGVEWTHYKGHANFLGVDQPYDGSFAANSDAEIRARFTSAHERGALITLNHPFEEGCGFALDFNSLPIDCLEVWNGPMRESNLRALGLWQSLLAAGKKLPVCAGSDYHRDTPFIFLGGPTTVVYAQSAGPSDILAALRAGHSYITFAPDGPVLALSAGDAILGDTAAWPQTKALHIALSGLAQGDVVRLVTAQGAATLLEAPAPGSFETTCPIEAPGFARVEVLRAFLPGIPRLPALLSNPIYFEAGQ
jgi:hypothetical protein